jgi:hypothetical protein
LSIYYLVRLDMSIYKIQKEWRGENQLHGLVKNILVNIKI